jgi:hypothetical protein
MAQKIMHDFELDPPELQQLNNEVCILVSSNVITWICTLVSILFKFDF